MPIAAHLLVFVGAYFLGSVPTGFLVAKAKGIDIRAHGSGNIGATNAFRILGTGAGIFVLLADALKGAAAVLLLPKLAPWLGDNAPSVYLALVAGLGAVLGHNYTCWLRFKGGKGIATSAGVLAALVPYAFLITFAVFLLVLATSRYVSLASITAAAVLPVATGLMPVPRPYFWLTVGLASLAIWKHHPNIQRLLAGTEARLGRKSAAGVPGHTPGNLRP